MGQPVNLQIPQPCNENWANMTPEENGRHCASCNRTVIDFSGMTDKQLFEFFKNYSGGACGRFYNDQLNRRIVVEQPKRTGWFRYVLTLLMPAMFAANRAAAQGEVIKKKTDTVCVPVKTTKAKKKQKAEKYQVEVKLPDSLVWESATLGFVVIPQEAPYVSPFTKFIADTLNRNPFTIFPNPATPGGMLRTTFKSKKGSHFIQVLDANGLLVQEQKLEAWNELMDIQVPIAKNILPGLYSVLLVDDKRKMIGSQKLIVQ